MKIVIKNYFLSHKNLIKAFALCFVLINGVNGQSRHSLNFDGQDDLVDLGCSGNFGPRDDDFTMTAWIKTDDTMQNAGVLSAGDNTPSSYGFGVAPNGRLRIRLGNNVYETNNYYSITADEWTHIAIKRTNSNVAGFVNGTPLTFLNTNGSYSINYDTWLVSCGLRIGWDQNDNSYFDGKIDEVTIWGRAVSDSEIQTYMFSEFTGQEEGLIGYYDFNEGQGSISNNSGLIDVGDGYLNGANWDSDTPFISGCTNSFASNFNPDANIDDGSCELYDNGRWFVSTSGSDSNEGSESQPVYNINMAINLSSDGDSVFVNSGTYNENLIIDKNINIISLGGPSNTVIYNNLFSALTISSNIFISGFTIRSSLPNENYNPACQIDGDGNGASAIMDNMIFKDSNLKGGIIEVYNGTLDVQNSLFHNNSCSSIIHHSSQSNASISNCTIVNNNNNNGDYNYLSYAQQGNTEFTNCIIRDNQTQNVSGSHNFSYSNVSGIETSAINIDADPLFCDASAHNFYISDNSPSVGSGQNGSNMGAFGIGCQLHIGPRWYISSNGSDDNDGSENSPFSTIQRAIDASEENDTLYLESGYYGVGGVGIELIERILIGFGDYKPTIDFGGNISSFIYGASMLLCSSDIENIILKRGYSIRGEGVVKIESTEISEFNKPIDVSNQNNCNTNSGNVLIKNSIIYNNKWSGMEWTIYNGSGVPTTILNSTIAQNSGAAYTLWGEFTVRNSIIYDNSTWGGGSTHSGDMTYSLLQFSYDGEGNINSNPQFIDAENFNFNLSSSSPCIDSGDPDGNSDGNNYTFDVNDQDLDGTRKDMGALYFHQENSGPIWYVSTSGSDDNDGSLNFPFITFEKAISVANANDTILVKPGTYNEPIYASFKDIVIMSLEGSQVTNIEGSVYDLVNELNGFNVQTSSEYSIRFSYPHTNFNGGTAVLKDIQTNSKVLIVNGNLDLNGLQSSSDIEIEALRFYTNYAPFVFNYSIKNSSFQNFQGYTSNEGYDVYDRDAYIDIDSSAIASISLTHLETNQNQDYFLTINHSEISGVSGASSNQADGLQNLVANHTIFKNSLNTKSINASNCNFINTVPNIISGGTLINSIIYPADSYWNDINSTFTLNGESEGLGNFQGEPLFCNLNDNDFSIYDNSPCVGAGQNGENIGAFGIGCELQQGCSDPYATNFDSDAQVNDGSCIYGKDNIVFMRQLTQSYLSSPELYSLQNNQWSEDFADYNGSSILSGELKIAYDNIHNRILVVKSSGSTGFETSMYNPLSNSWEDGGSYDYSYSHDGHRAFDVEFDPINNLFIIAHWDPDGIEHIYTYNHSSLSWNEIALCNNGSGEHNGIKLNYNPYKKNVYLTKQYSNSLIQYNIDVSGESCEEEIVHSVSSSYNDADAVVFDSKRNRFLYLKSDFNPNDHGNELTIMAFDDNTDPSNGDLSEYSVNYRDFDGYHFDNDAKIQAVYLPQSDKLLVLMFVANTLNDWDSHNFYAIPYTFDFETNGWDSEAQSFYTGGLSSGYSDIVLLPGEVINQNIPETVLLQSNGDFWSFNYDHNDWSQLSMLNNGSTGDKLISYDVESKKVITLDKSAMSIWAYDYETDT